MNDITCKFAAAIAQNPVDGEDSVSEGDRQAHKTNEEVCHRQVDKPHVSSVSQPPVSFHYQENQGVSKSADDDKQPAGYSEGHAKRVGKILFRLSFVSYDIKCFV